MEVVVVGIFGVENVGTVSLEKLAMLTQDMQQGFGTHVLAMLKMFTKSAPAEANHIQTFGYSGWRVFEFPDWGEQIGKPQGAMNLS